MATQLSLGVAVLLIRNEAWDEAQLLPSLAAALGLTDNDPFPPLPSMRGSSPYSLSLPRRSSHLHPRYLWLLHGSLLSVRHSRRGGPSVLTAMATWCEHAAATGSVRRLAAALICGRAWCSAGLVESSAVCDCALLVQIPVKALGSPQLSDPAADVLCAALAAALEPLPSGGMWSWQGRRCQRQQQRWWRRQ